MTNIARNNQRNMGKIDGTDKPVYHSELDGIILDKDLITQSYVDSGGIEITKDITGLSTIDLTGLSGSLIINLTSANPIETIDILSNGSNVKRIIFRPEVGLDVTFNDKSVNGGAANMKLFAPNLTPIGSNYGFLELVKRNSEFYQDKFIDQYT